MDYKKKMKIYKFFGAEVFQQVVFKVENIKYKIIDKFFPNIVTWYDNLCDYNYLRRIKKIKDNNTKEEIAKQFKREKMSFRKELVYKQNRNYHYNKNYPTEFLAYLKSNKRIHERGLVGNIIVLSCLGIYLLLSLPKSSIVLALLGGYELVSMFVNFECINLQNYNLCRFENERMENMLKKLEESKTEKNIKEMGSFTSSVFEVIHKENEVPTIDMVLENITTREQTTDFLKYARSQLLELQNNESQIIDGKVRKIGTKK